MAKVEENLRVKWISFGSLGGKEEGRREGMGGKEEEEGGGTDRNLSRQIPVSEMNK